MSTQLNPRGVRLEELREGREIIRAEADALHKLSQRLDGAFSAAVEQLRSCSGLVVVCGVGKAGLVGKKITATLCSTGTRAVFLHPAEAVHGDLGCVTREDTALVLSNSGETEEVCRLLPMFSGMGVPVVAITAREESTLGRAADITITLGALNEAGQLGLAPTTSTTAMLAVGDALALVVSRSRGFTRQQFARNHPAGNLGLALKTVADVMRRGDQLRIAPQRVSIRDVLAGSQRGGRRTGAVMLVDDAGKLAGIFTDSDLVRLLEGRGESQLDGPVSEVMTANPLQVQVTSALGDAVQVLSSRRISELPVVDAEGRPVGLIDITDVIGLVRTEDD